ncbi:MAG: ribosome biogenesis GTP-binding protein YihA/YsxC [Clostridia bacterium]
MIIKNSAFVTSVKDSANRPEFGMLEIAIAGKSNVGKSTFINYITNVGRLAKTSSKPGLTKLVNYFNINNGEFMFVDLPGYGFAKVSEVDKLDWGVMVENYLVGNDKLVNVFVLVDIRREPSQLDKQMIAFLYHFHIPFTVIATKCDKLSKLAINAQKQVISTALTIGRDSIITVSALNKTGKEEVCAKIESILASAKERENEEK